MSMLSSDILGCGYENMMHWLLTGQSLSRTWMLIIHVACELFLNVMDAHLMVLSIESTKISENDFAIDACQTYHYNNYY